MGYFTDSVAALAATMRNFFRPATTVQYPKVIRPRAERYRASFALLHDEQGDEACIGCLQCERICPSKVISIKGPVKKDSPITGKKRGYADDFTLDLSACIFCELCVQVCPTDAIVMTREQEQPAFAREDLVLTMAKLYANEKSKPRAWGDGTRLMEMQAIPKPPAPPKVEPPVAAKPDPAPPKPEAAPAPADAKPEAVAVKPAGAPIP
ncbi:MAG: NADH-quinone oxidoreductase [Myxococcaceae bacterium]|nr:NADH-quinone oxidoreductase [Myxococcaceae bacterium]